MNAKKAKRLAKKGWRVGNAEDFLGLTPAEVAYIEMKLALGLFLKQQRMRQQLTQMQLASLLSSSQARVARMEAGDPSVSIDLIIKSLLALGATPADLADALTRSPGTPS